MKCARGNLNLGSISGCMLRTQRETCSGYSHLSPKGARVPAPDQTPSTHAPFLPITASTKRSSSWSYSILA